MFKEDNSTFSRKPRVRKKAQATKSTQTSMHQLRFLLHRLELHAMHDGVGASDRDSSPDLFSIASGKNCSCQVKRKVDIYFFNGEVTVRLTLKVRLYLLDS